MKLKEALHAAFARERRPSRRAELLAFVRRYAAPDAAVTHYRGTGDASDVILPFLADCGVETGKSVVLERSSLDKGAWQLRWSADKSVGEFVALCRRAGEGAVDAVLMDVAKGVDGVAALAMKFPADPESVTLQAAGVELPDGTLAIPERDLAFVERLAARTRQILATVAGLAGSGRSTVPNLRESEGVIAEYASCLLAADKTLIAPLEVIEAYVRLDTDAVKGLAYYGSTPRIGVFTVPPALFTTPAAAWRDRVEVLARGISRGREDTMVPVEGTLSMPLDALLGKNEYGGPDVECFDEDNVSPLKGFLSNDAADFPQDAYAVLAFGNAHLACSSKWAVPDRVTPAAFAANDPISFWDYVRWLYDRAYFGVAQCGLTHWARIGCNDDCGTNFRIDEKNLDNADSSGASWYWRVVEKAPNTSVAAFYAVILMDSASGMKAQAHHKACNLFTEPPGRSVEVLSAEEAKARVAGDDPDAAHGSGHSRKDELPLEWFLMTHSAGKLWGAGTQEGAMVDDWSNDEIKRRNNLGAMRTFAATASAAVLSRACSLGVHQELRPMPLPDGTGFDFNVASSFYSTLVGLLRRFAPDDGQVPLREWADQRRWQYALHDPQSVVCAAYSGIATDLSPTLADAIAPTSEFPDVKALPLHKFAEDYDNASRWFTTTPQFTNFVSELASGDAKFMLRMAQRTRGTPRRRVLVVETNVDAERYFEGLYVDEAHRLDERLRCLFAQAFMYRSSDTIGLVEASRGFAGLYVAVTSTPTGVPAWMRGKYPYVRGLDQALRDDCGIADQSRFFYRRGAVPDGFNAAGTEWRDDLKVGARIDTFGRLYLVFEAKGDAAQACHVHWRHHAGLPVLSAALASAFGERGPANPYVVLGPAGRADPDTAKLVLDTRLGSFSEEEYRRTMLGGEWAFRGWITPLALRHAQNWKPPELPKRDWFEGVTGARVSEML